MCGEDGIIHHSPPSRMHVTRENIKSITTQTQRVTFCTKEKLKLNSPNQTENSRQEIVRRNTEQQNTLQKARVKKEINENTLKIFISREQEKHLEIL